MIAPRRNSTPLRDLELAIRASPHFIGVMESTDHCLEVQVAYDPSVISMIVRGSREIGAVPHINYCADTPEIRDIFIEISRHRAV